MRVLAFDPGAEIGWAALDHTGKLLDSYGSTRGMNHVEQILSDFSRVASAADIVAVERNPFFATGQRAFNPSPLIDAAFVGGTIKGLAMGHGLTVVEASAHQWRQAIVGKRTANDAEVKAALLRIMPGLPRCNAHVRDAIGLALYAGKRRQMGDAAKLEAERLETWEKVLP